VVQRGNTLRDSWLQSQQLQGREPEQLTVLDGVAEWQVYFWRGQGWSNAQSSGDTVAVAEPVAPPSPPASGASAPAGGASSPGGGAANPTGGASAPAPGASAPATRLRSLLPTGVRLQIDLPEGRIVRDVMLTPAA
jgi:hypothetical protein